MVPELRAHVVGMCDADAAGPLAQANRAWHMLLQERLAALWAARLQAQREAASLELQQALHTQLALKNLLVVNDVGDGQFACRVVAFEAQRRPARATFTCICCGRTQCCGHGFSNVQRHLASKEHWISHRRRVYNLDFDAAAWHAFVASIPGQH